jgi:hypothetical protein
MPGPCAEVTRPRAAACARASGSPHGTDRSSRRCDESDAIQAAATWSEHTAETAHANRIDRQEALAQMTQARRTDGPRAPPPRDRTQHPHRLWAAAQTHRLASGSNPSVSSARSAAYDGSAAAAKGRRRARRWSIRAASCSAARAASQLNIGREGHVGDMLRALEGRACVRACVRACARTLPRLQQHRVPRRGVLRSAAYLLCIAAVGVPREARRDVERPQRVEVCALWLVPQPAARAQRRHCGRVDVHQRPRPAVQKVRDVCDEQARGALGIANLRGQDRLCVCACGGQHGV